MIILSTASDILRLTTTTANALAVHASYTDSSVVHFAPGRQNTAIAAVATTTILSAVGSSLTRALKSLTVKAGGGANTVTIEYFDGTTAFQLQSVALAQGESIEYEDAAGWRVRAADGSLKGLGQTGPTGATGPAANPTQSHIGWAPTAAAQTSNLLTLLAAGHAPGLYTVNISQMTATTTAGYGQETVSWSNGGAKTIATDASTASPRWNVAGLAVSATQRTQYPRSIYSDGVSAITAQVTAGGTIVTPVVDIYASACRVGT